MVWKSFISTLTELVEGNYLLNKMYRKRSEFSSTMERSFAGILGGVTQWRVMFVGNSKVRSGIEL